MSDYPPPTPPAPPPVGYYPPAQPTSTTAVISLIGGILGWTVFFGIGGIIAVITGHIAQGEINRSGGAIGGGGLATAGLILGYSSLAIWIVVMVVGLVAGLGFSLCFLGFPCIGILPALFPQLQDIFD